MSNAGITLGAEQGEMFLVLGGYPLLPSFWQMVVTEEGFNPLPFFFSGSEEPKQILRMIQERLASVYQIYWDEPEFEKIEKLIVVVIEQVRSFERLISDPHLSDRGIRYVFLDITKALRVEIQAAIFQFLQARRPDAARLILEGFRRIGEDTPEWAVPVPG